MPIYDSDYDSDYPDYIAKTKELCDCVIQGDCEKVKKLLEKGISIEAKEYNRILFYNYQKYFTPLQLATKYNQQECLKFLISNGASINAQNQHGVTALHIAAAEGLYGCLLLLLEAGADCTLLTQPSSKDFLYIKDDHFPGKSTALHLASANNHVECIKELVQYGADYNCTDEKGRTSLYLAAENGHEEAVLTLLMNAMGKDILSIPAEHTGNTPLHYCVKKRQEACVRELLAHGSDVNHRNNSQHSPLDLAILESQSDLNSKEKVPSMVRLLIEYGYNTDLNAHGATGFTPLHYVSFQDNDARFCRQPLLAAFLIAYGASPLITKQRGGLNLIQSELKMRYPDWIILKAVIRSLRSLPSLVSLNLSSYYKVKHGMLEPLRMQLAPPRLHSRFRSLSSPLNGRYGSDQMNKYAWYDSIASNPRSLKHLSRCIIRETLGPSNIRLLKLLPLPSSLKQYLLLDIDVNITQPGPSSSDV